jgi:hypothetical protein
MLAQEQHRREEKTAEKSFEDNPDVKALRSAWAIEKQVSKFMDDLEDGDA